MTTATLTQAVNRINARAAAVDVRQVLLRALLVTLMAVPFALFFAARLVLRGASWAAAWLWAAGIEGWEAAGPKRESDAG